MKLPICYDLDGRPGDEVSLYTVDSRFSVEATLIHSPFKKKLVDKNKVTTFIPGNRTYFGVFRFRFFDARTEVVVTPKLITVTRVDDVKGMNEVGLLRAKELVWPDKVHGRILYKITEDKLPLTSRFKRVLSSRFSHDLTITHERWDVIGIQYGGEKFFVDRGSRKYRTNRDSPLEKTEYLGIYLKHDEDVYYGGIMGEFIGRRGSITTSNSQTFFNFRGRSVPVSANVRLDHLNKKRFRCWKVDEVMRLLEFPVDHYFRHH